VKKRETDGCGTTDHAVELPIDGVLDLHTFSSKDVKELLPEYFTACRRKGLFEIRVIHGKGTGALRKTVHSLLEKMPGVASFRTASEDAGGWGATLVQLNQEQDKTES